MRTCKEQCIFGVEYDQCCIKCERYMSSQKTSRIM